MKMSVVSPPIKYSNTSRRNMDSAYETRDELYTTVKKFINASDVCKNQQEAVLKYAAMLAVEILEDKPSKKLSVKLKNRLLNPTVEDITKAEDMAKKVAAYIREDEANKKKLEVSNSKILGTKPLPGYIREVVEDNVTKLVFDTTKFADYINEHFNTKYFNKRIYIYDSNLCCYKKANNEIETLARDIMKEHNVEVSSFSYFIKEITAQISAMGGYAEYPFDSIEDELPVLNGILKFDFITETVKLIPHGPEHMFTYKLGVYYDPSVSTAMAIKQLSCLVDNPDRLIQIPAQAICQCQIGQTYKKAHMLQGPPNSGKSSFIAILNRMIPKEYLGNVTLESVCGDKFAGGDLEGKLMNIYDDIEEVPLKSIAAFKTLTGSCQHRIERKFDPAYAGRITAVNMFSCNFPPWIAPRIYKDSAFWSRWEYIIFQNNFNINPKFYEETYTPEFMASFLNYMIVAIFRIRKSGLLHVSDIETVMDSWKINSDPLYDFVEECFVKEENEIVNMYSKEKLYHLYKLYCRRHNVSEDKIKPTLTAFTQAIQALGFIPHKHRVKGILYPVYQTSAWYANDAVLKEYEVELSFDKPLSLDMMIGG